MPHLGIIADDLTGATTVGALLARSKMENVVFLDQEKATNSEFRHDAVVFTSDSRALPPAQAREKVYSLTKVLQGLGVSLFSKRIDTTCRGGIGYEVDAMLEALAEEGDERIAVIVPAMPQSRRIVVEGWSLIDSVLLSRTGVANDVRTPVTESHLVKLLQPQLQGKLAHISVARINEGAEVLKVALSDARGSGAKAILVDATSVADISAIATCISELKWKILCVDPGVFTQQYMLSQGFGVPDGQIEEGTTTGPEDRQGTVLVVAGSAAEVTHHQMSAVLKDPQAKAIQVCIRDLLVPEDGFTDTCQKYLSELLQLKTDGAFPSIVVLGLQSTLTGVREDVALLEKEMSLVSGEGPSLISRRFGRLAQKIGETVGENLTGMYLTGGDVMVETCKASGACGLEMVGYVIPQADQARLVGGTFDGLPVVCKGGLTGSKSTAVQCVNRIFEAKGK